MDTPKRHWMLCTECALGGPELGNEDPARTQPIFRRNLLNLGLDRLALRYHLRTQLLHGSQRFYFCPKSHPTLD